MHRVVHLIVLALLNLLHVSELQLQAALLPNGFMALYIYELKTNQQKQTIKIKAAI